MARSRSKQKARAQRRRRGDAVSRAEAREAARLARREERQQFEAKARWQRPLKRLAFGVAGIAAAGAVIFFLFRPGPEVPGVEKPPDEGRAHVTAPLYGTPTPTSGPHLPTAPGCGSFSEPLELGLAVHALEHGAVVIWYRTDLAGRLEKPLLDLLQRWDSHVIVSPNDEIEAPIVATAWNRLKRYQRPADVVEFVETYRERGPEDIPCDVIS